VSRLVDQPSPPFVSVAIVVHVPAPSGERWNATDATPEPPSAALAESARLPRRNWPGSVSVPVGAVLSMRTFAAVCVRVLPAWSVTKTRRS
jgi:hypothetical protein